MAFASPGDDLFSALFGDPQSGPPSVGRTGQSFLDSMLSAVDDYLNQSADVGRKRLGWNAPPQPEAVNASGESRADVAKVQVPQPKPVQMAPNQSATPPDTTGIPWLDDIFRYMSAQNRRGFGIDDPETTPEPYLFAGETEEEKAAAEAGQGAAVGGPWGGQKVNSAGEPVGPVANYGEGENPYAETNAIVPPAPVANPDELVDQVQADKRAARQQAQTQKAASMVQSSAVKNTGKQIKHVVKKGDTLGNIAYQYGKGQFGALSLAEQNSMAQAKGLRPGQVIEIPEEWIKSGNHASDPWRADNGFQSFAQEQAAQGKAPAPAPAPAAAPAPAGASEVVNASGETKAQVQGSAAAAQGAAPAVDTAKLQASIPKGATVKMSIGQGQAVDVDAQGYVNTILKGGKVYDPKSGEVLFDFGQLDPSQRAQVAQTTIGQIPGVKETQAAGSFGADDFAVNATDPNFFDTTSLNTGGVGQGGLDEAGIRWSQGGQGQGAAAAPGGGVYKYQASVIGPDGKPQQISADIPKDRLIQTIQAGGKITQNGKVIIDTSQLDEKSKAAWIASLQKPEPAAGSFDPREWDVASAGGQAPAGDVQPASLAQAAQAVAGMDEYEAEYQLMRRGGILEKMGITDDAAKRKMAAAIIDQAQASAKGALKPQTTTGAPVQRPTQAFDPSGLYTGS